MPPQRLYALDLLRFFAATGVLLYHYLYNASPGAVSWLASFGYLGVNVFFVISGFVVLWSCRGRTPAAFVRARVLRLYPEFWLCVLLSAVVFGVRGQSLSGAEIAANLTMLPAYLGAPYVDGVYWTLAVEMKFYALLWLLLVLGQMPRVERWLLLWLAVSLLGRFVDLGPLKSASLGVHGPLFASGGLLYLAYESGWTRLRAAALIVGVALSAVAATEGMAGFVQPADITPSSVAVTVLFVLAAFALFVGIKYLHVPERLRPAAALLGGLTYPLYLLHNVGKALLLGGGVAPLTFVLATALSLGLAYGIMRLADWTIRPGLRAAMTPRTTATLGATIGQ